MEQQYLQRIGNTLYNEGHCSPNCVCSRCWGARSAYPNLQYCGYFFFQLPPLWYHQPLCAWLIQRSAKVFWICPAQPG